jgi:hypothetical protein
METYIFIIWFFHLFFVEFPFPLTSAMQGECSARFLFSLHTVTRTVKNGQNNQKAGTTLKLEQPASRNDQNAGVTGKAGKKRNDPCAYIWALMHPAPLGDAGQICCAYFEIFSRIFSRLACLAY